MLQPTRIAAVLMAASLAAMALGACSYALLDTNPTASFAQADKPAWTRSAEPPPVIEAPQTTDTPPQHVEAPPPNIEGLMNSAQFAGQPYEVGAASRQAQPSQAGIATKPTMAAASSLFVAARPGEARPIQPAPQRPVEAKPIEVARLPIGVRPLDVPPPPPPVERRRVEPRGNAYLFRGVGGLIYSRGMDRLAEEINRTGVKASVSTYLMWRVVVNEAIQAYRKDRAPITIIGHSAGGDSAVAFAHQLNSVGIPVSLLVTYDPTRVAADVPPNVERFINVYQSRNIMGGGDVTPGHGFHGHYASINLKDHGEIVHINIEKSERIHDQLVRKIAELAATPVAAAGEKIPIRYVVPARAAIDLWDSGTPVLASPGDTLQSIAAAYRVPAWAVAQINKLSEGARLKPGQRIVVPRNLAPGEPVETPVSGLGASGR